MTITLEQRNALIAKIAKVYLGSIFEYVAPNPEHDNALGIFRHSLYRSEVYFMTDSWSGQKGKLHVSMNVPKDSLGQDHLSYYRPEEKMCSINIADTKTPEQIASDIERRLLPDFLRLSRLNDERIAETEANIAERIHIGDSIAKEFPKLNYHNDITQDRGVHRKGKQDIGFDTYNVALWPNTHITIGYGGNIEIKVESLTLEEAKRILTTLELLKQFDRG